jgi:hypothetical protein
MNKNFIFGIALLILAAAGFLTLENLPSNGPAPVTTTNNIIGSITTLTAATMPAVSSKAGNFTIIVLPDTQHYSESYPQIFANQTAWILGQVSNLNIVFVIHEGDLVENPNSDIEWQRANASMSVLDGRVPYSVLPGNHDQSDAYNQYFNPERFANYPWYGGNYSGNKNNYQLFSAGGREYIAISLEACPSMNELQWANTILQNNKNRKAIITTHGYINENAQRNVHVCGDTNYIRNTLIAPNENVFLVLNGHTHSESRRTDKAGSHTVHQLLADYQDMPEGGSGWLRILTFAPSESRIYVETYSPYLGQYKDGPESQFTLDI